MALYLKQDFNPPILSRRWIAMKFRPNMLLYSRQHIISILESGLLFREDSIEVEQEAPAPEDVWRAAGGGAGGWFTRGERLACVSTVSACLLAFPPRSVQRSTLLHIAAYISLPVAMRAFHRLACRGCLPELLSRMRDYLALARRAAACLKECAALRAELGSVSSVIESTHTMLCRQQSEMAVVLSRASSAVLGNAPWLRSDVAWDALESGDADNLLKIHHAFLVVQSTLLKHIAMSHYIPTAHAQKLYKNHNERIYWIHNTLIKHLNEMFKENYETLERMYRLLKNYGNNDYNMNKKPGKALQDSWLYSDVHSGVARCNLELKLALKKCHNLDLFLDSCALNKQDIDLEILNKDIDVLIDDLTKCLTTMQSSQIRLKKLQNKFSKDEKKVDGENEFIEKEEDLNILRIEDKEPESKDEVFYLLKTEDDDTVQPVADISTGPGKKEKEATKIVMNELKRKLVRREDVMRERERQALVKTMPQLKDNLPEFPRQIKIEEFNRKGFIGKLPKKVTKKRLFHHYKINNKKSNKLIKKYKPKTNKYTQESDIENPFYEANRNLNAKSKYLTFDKNKKSIIITKWYKNVQIAKQAKELDSSGMSEGLSDVEAGTVNKSVTEAVNLNHNNGNGDAINFRFSKKDLELSPSSSESDFELYKEKQMALLKDARRQRAARKKNYPDKRAAATSEADKLIDESLKPVEYSLGAGISMAALLQSGRPPPAAPELVFAGSGLLSDDSGHE